MKAPCVFLRACSVLVACGVCLGAPTLYVEIHTNRADSAYAPNSVAAWSGGQWVHMSPYQYGWAYAGMNGPYRSYSADFLASSLYYATEAQRTDFSRWGVKTTQGGSYENPVSGWQSYPGYVVFTLGASAPAPSTYSVRFPYVNTTGSAVRFRAVNVLTGEVVSEETVAAGSEATVTLSGYSIAVPLRIEAEFWRERVGDSGVTSWGWETVAEVPAGSWTTSGNPTTVSGGSTPASAPIAASAAETHSVPGRESQAGLTGTTGDWLRESTYRATTDAMSKQDRELAEKQRQATWDASQDISETVAIAADQSEASALTREEAAQLRGESALSQQWGLSNRLYGVTNQSESLGWLNNAVSNGVSAFNATPGLSEAVANGLAVAQSPTIGAATRSWLVPIPGGTNTMDFYPLRNATVAAFCAEFRAVAVWGLCLGWVWTIWRWLGDAVRTVVHTSSQGSATSTPLVSVVIAIAACVIVVAAIVALVTYGLNYLGGDLIGLDVWSVIKGPLFATPAGSFLSDCLVLADAMFPVRTIILVATTLVGVKMSIDKVSWAAAVAWRVAFGCLVFASWSTVAEPVPVEFSNGATGQVEWVDAAGSMAFPAGFYGRIVRDSGTSTLAGVELPSDLLSSGNCVVSVTQAGVDIWDAGERLDAVVPWATVLCGIGAVLYSLHLVRRLFMAGLTEGGN